MNVAACQCHYPIQVVLSRRASLFGLSPSSPTHCHTQPRCLCQRHRSFEPHRLVSTIHWAAQLSRAPSRVGRRRPMARVRCTGQLGLKPAVGPQRSPAQASRAIRVGRFGREVHLGALGSAQGAPYQAGALQALRSRRCPSSYSGSLLRFVCLLPFLQYGSLAPFFYSVRQGIVGMTSWWFVHAWHGSGLLWSYIRPCCSSDQAKDRVAWYRGAACSGEADVLAKARPARPEVCKRNSWPRCAGFAGCCGDACGH